VAVSGTLMQSEDKKSRIIRALFLLLGLTCVGVGYVGVFVPGIPSTICFICALWAFKRSSPRFENWLLNHKVFGPTLRDWDEHKAITLRVKVIAIATMAVFAGVSLFIIKKQWVQALVAVTVVLVAIYIATRKTKLIGPTP
jgi:uncharacterized protein